MVVVTFWIAIAVISIFGMHLARRTQELKHETLRMLVDKGEKIDESLLRELLGPPGQGARQNRQQHKGRKRRCHAFGNSPGKGEHH